ncbi:hypothetical protein JL722_8838 [Aureococcus anophagefferens]|nr:hypothetical protein JL722_8838 [Aureococcus anophagefferens]
MRLALLAAACPGALALPWSRIACMGDSITRGDTTHTDEPEGKLDRGNYPMRWETSSASTSRTSAPSAPFGQAGLRRRGRGRRRLRPDCVVVMLGINDAKLEWDEDDFVEAYADLVEATIARRRA